MGKLQVIFRIGLAHPVLLTQGIPDLPAIATFADTKNTVRIEPLGMGHEPNPTQFGGFDQMVLHVERECTDEQGADTSFVNYRRLRIPQDAARAFWQLFEAIREAELRRNNTICGYPVALAEEIQYNLLVRGCEVEWTYDGKKAEKTGLGGLATISFGYDSWADAVQRLATGAAVPVYTSFALDAVYFSERDPLRAVIMACAAWETALRYYLANVASKRDPAYLTASTLRGLPTLLKFAESARGGSLFYDVFDAGSKFEQLELDSHRKSMHRLSNLRNKLLHEGKTALPEGAALDSALAVLSAIEWLFAGSNP